jgi:predicted GIY-YIG superfamily endonuclease
MHPAPEAPTGAGSHAQSSIVVYAVRSVEGLVYVGYSVDVGHRLRQHNRVIGGGAWATLGHAWHVSVTISGFESCVQAQRIEHRLKLVRRRHRRRRRQCAETLFLDAEEAANGAYVVRRGE